MIAAITSCTNTSNPSVMIGAGLLARNAVAQGLKARPWVKTSLSPGSRVVADYLAQSGLQRSLDTLGFQPVGFGCMTCMGNSGPLPAPVAEAIEENGVTAVAVLSGNRNFEGRIHPSVRANFLASPPLVVAYALAGSVLVDLVSEPLGEDGEGKPVYLRDIWPDGAEIRGIVDEVVTPALFRARYATILEGTPSGGPCAAPRAPRSRGPPEHLHPAAAVLRRHGRRGARARRHPRRARAGDVRGYVHHRPHLADRCHLEGHARRRLSRLARHRAARFRQLRGPAPEPRRDDPRHVRQCPGAERDDAGRRGQQHGALPGRRAHADPCRGGQVPRRGRAAGGDRRQRIRRRVLARLGGEGHAPAGRAHGDRRELRAHPPCQPRRHGRAAAAVPRRRHAQVARPDRRGARRRRRHPRVRRPAERARLYDYPLRRQARHDPVALAPGHDARGRLFPQRRPAAPRGAAPTAPRVHS